MDVFDLIAKLKLDSSEYDKGLEDSEKSASTFGQKLKTGLGVAGGVTVSAIAAIGTASVVAGKELVKSANEVAEYGDNIDKMSQKLGISAEAYQEWDAIMQHSGSSIESLKGSMKTLATQAQKGNEAFQQLGISEEEIASLSQEDLFAKVIAGLQNMEEGTERTYIASQLLGRGATELGALLNTSAEDTEAMRQRVHELGGVMSDEAVKAAAKYQDTLQDMQTGFEGLKRNLVSDFLPSFVTVMEGLTSFSEGKYGLGAEQIAEGISNVADELMSKVPVVTEIGTSLIKALAKAMVTNLPVLSQTVLDILSMLIALVSEFVPELLPEVLKVITELFGQLSDYVPKLLSEDLPKLLEAVLNIIQILVNFVLTDGLPLIIQALPAIIVGIIDFILSSSAEVTNAFVTILIAVVDAFPDILVAIVEALPEIIVGLITAILKNAPLLSQAVLKLTILSLVIIPMVIVEILKRLPEIFEAIVNGFKERWPELKQAGLDALLKSAEGMGDNEVFDKIAEIIGSLIISGIDKIKSFSDAFKDAGKSIMDGLIRGIKDKVSEVTDVISGVATTVSSAFKKVLGIASPSKVFAGFGQFIDEGLAQGIEKGMGAVDNAMDSLYDTVIEGFDIPSGKPSPKGAGAGGMQIAGSNTVVQQLVLPVYIGQERIKTIMVDANNLANYESGGR